MKAPSKIIFVLLVLLYGTKFAHAQKDPVTMYCDSAVPLMNHEPAKAMTLIKKAYALCRAGSKTKDEGRPTYIMATIYRNMGEYDSALFYYDICDKQHIASQSPPLTMIETVAAKAILYSMQGKLDKSLECFLQAQRVYEQENDSVRIAKNLNNIAGIYYSTYQPDKALLYFNRSIAMRERLKMLEDIYTPMMNAAVIYMERQQFAEAKAYLDKGLKYALANEDRENLGTIYNKLGYLYQLKKEYAKSISYDQQALEIRTEMEDEHGIAECLLDMGITYNQSGDHKHSIATLEKALAHAKAINSMEQVAEILDLLALQFEGLGDYKNAYTYLVDYRKYDSLITNEEVGIRIAELQEKYEADEKEKNIAKLNEEKAKQQVEIYKQKVQLNVILIISIGAILILSFVYYRYSLKQKNKSIAQESRLNRQKVEALEEKRALQERQQKEILQVVINAQEEERRKIAIDMHDGLGQLLSGVKLNLEHLLTQKSIPADLDILIRNIKELSEESIAESKSIASDLLPYNIKDFGLVTAIKNLCYKNDQLKISKVKFYSRDVPRTLPPDMEIALYRIAQELINNALKHAKANEIFVQLFYRDHKLVLQVEDDGQGFSKEEASAKASSMGLKNMEIRVKLLEGHIEIDSVVGQGTTTLIELPLTV